MELLREDEFINFDFNTKRPKNRSIAELIIGHVDRNEPINASDNMLESKYKLATEKNDSDAQLYIGKYLWENHINDFKGENSGYYLMLAADNNNAEAQFLLGTAFYYHTNEFDKAFDYLKKAADNGYKDALSMLGLCYYNGVGIKRDKDIALEYFIKSGDTGQMSSYTMAAQIYMERKEFDNFEHYLQRAAQGGDKMATILLSHGTSALEEYIQSAEIKNDASKQLQIMALYFIKALYTENEQDLDNVIDFGKKAFSNPQGGATLKNLFKELGKTQEIYNVILDLCGEKDNDESNQTIESQFFENHYLKAFDNIFNLLDVEHFSNWTYECAISGDTILNMSTFNNLKQITTYVKSRPKHKDYAEWDSLLVNLGLLINDFCNVYDIHAELRNDNHLHIKRFYKISPYNPNYDEDLEAYNQYIFLISDLLFEIARLCNLILVRIREIYPDYKEELGILYIDDCYSSPDLVYKESEISDAPYPGIEQYLDARLGRETHYGSKSGIGKDGYELKTN